MKRWIFCLLASLFLTASATADVLGANDQPIHDAARIGSGKEIDVLLKVNPNTRDVRTAQGSTPLHLAATNPDISALKALIAAGADPNARDADGATPLHMAAYSQNAKHSQLLLEAGSFGFFGWVVLRRLRVFVCTVVAGFLPKFRSSQ